MDDELKELGALALRNAFWTNFSALVNDTLKASRGLIDEGRQLEMLGELTSVYGRARPETAPSGGYPKIFTYEDGRLLNIHSNMVKALREKGADRIDVNGETCFTHDEAGEWVWVEPAR